MASTANDFSVIPSDPAWIDLLKSTKVGDIVEKGRPIVKTQYFEEVSTLLRRLSEAKVLSAVVIDPDPKIGVIGFVDVLDLLVFVLNVTDQTTKDFSTETIQNLKWEGQCFERQNTGSLVNLSRADPLYKISSDASLWEAVKLMSNEIHRLAVLDKTTPQNYIGNVLSQSDIVNFIATRGAWVGTKMSKSIESVGLTALGVATVLDNVDVLGVLRYMRDYKVGAVGIVDHFGRLVGNFSASDLLGLNADNFSLLRLGVKEYILRTYGFPKPPVCVATTDTVEFLLYKMTVHKVHQVYIVDEEFFPKGVIAMTDLMQFLLMA